MNFKLISLVFLSFLCSLAIGQTWQQKANFSGPARLGGEAFSIHGKGYLACGVNRTTNTYYNDVWEYDPSNDSWTAKAATPMTPRAAGVVLNNDSCVLIGLGWNGSSTFYDFYRYTPSTDSWDTLAAYPGNGGRNSFYASYKNKAYVGGGGYNTSTPYKKDFWEYNITTNVWTSKGDLPFGRRVVGVCVNIDSILYMGMGHNGNQDYNDLWAYNTLTESWSQKISMPGFGRMGASFFVLNGKLIVGGGHRLNSGGITPLTDYYEYDPTSNTWTAFSNAFTNSQITLAVSFVINSDVYVYGGTNSYPAPINNVSVYKNQTVSIDEMAIPVEEELSIYPNPNSGELFLTSKNEILDGLFTIFNQTGQLVFERQFIQEKGPVRIDISGFENASYYYKLVKESGQSSSGTIIKVN